VPWDIAKVSGKLTFSDGSPIKLTNPDGTPVKIMRITLQFIPQDPPTGRVQLKTATAEVDVETGIFESATTLRPAGDGAIVGNHKIIFQIYQQLEDGSIFPMTDMPGIPDKYRSPVTTPLKVVVTKNGENYFPLMIEKDTSFGKQE
jgi:hypothetical protein